MSVQVSTVEGRNLTAESQHGDTSSHLALDGKRDLENKLLDAVHGTGLDNGTLVALATGSEVPEGRDGVALNLLVFVKGQKANERLEEPGLNDGGLVGGVNRDIADTGGGRQDKREVGRVEKAEKGFEAIGLDNLDLVLFCARQTRLYHGTHHH